MAPTAIDNEVPIHIRTKPSYPQSQRASSILDQYESFDVTPSIGREFPKANLVEWLNARNADELIRDLGVTSGSDPEISTISSLQIKKYYRKPLEDEGLSPKRQTTAQWHSDIAFEPVPADYSSLRLVELPKTGGDTLWASGYEIYDRFSTPYHKFLESLTVTFEQPGFAAAAERGGFTLYDKPRGNPKNVGSILKAVHPVVRTNPVTGWKSVFPVGGHVKHINDVTPEESKHLLDWFLDPLQRNHEVQVRFKWQNANDIAIWDNRSTFHTATFDYGGQGERFGNRAVGVGEAPYQDPNSKGRRESLGLSQVIGEYV
ncbi:TfdA family taurine catabolism dioxygenase TauD [Colletotrichum cereale]|nr:TfdA family taurine catabolism dioxygenase TauD [Colletotrichum cereale]